MEIPTTDRNEITKVTPFQEISNLKSEATERILAIENLQANNHEAPEDSVNRVISSFDLSENEYSELAAGALAQLEKLDQEESRILQEATQKAKEYRTILNGLN